MTSINTPITKKCVKCRKKIEVKSNVQKYCQECIHTKKLEYNKKYKALQKLKYPKELKCRNCGTDISKLKWAKKYCRKCKLSVLKKQTKEYYQKNRERALIYARERYKLDEVKNKHRINALNYYHRNKKIKKI